MMQESLAETVDKSVIRIFFFSPESLPKHFHVRCSSHMERQDSIVLVFFRQNHILNDQTRRSGVGGCIGICLSIETRVDAWSLRWDNGSLGEGGRWLLLRLENHDRQCRLEVRVFVWGEPHLVVWHFRVVVVETTT